MALGGGGHGSGSRHGRRGFDARSPDPPSTLPARWNACPPGSTDSSCSPPPSTATSAASSSRPTAPTRGRPHGVPTEFVQDNHSRSRRGTLRGIHFQTHPGQGKLVRVARGRVLDVVVDLRRGSPTFGEWEALRARRRARPPAVDPGRLRPRLLRALRDGRLRLQVHELLRRGDRGGHPLRRPRRRHRVAGATSSCSTPSATATPRGSPRSPTRCRSATRVSRRRPLRAQPDRHAAPRQPAHRAAGVAVRALAPARASSCGWRTSTTAACGRRGRASSCATCARSGSTGTARSCSSRTATTPTRRRSSGCAPAGDLYECFCTRAEIRAAASAPHGPLPEGAYPGTCLRLTEAERRRKRAGGRPPALRVRAGGARVAFTDRLHGAARGRRRRLRGAPQRRRARLQPRGRRRRRLAGDRRGRARRRPARLDAAPALARPSCSGCPRRRTRTCRSCSGRTARGWPSATAR